MAAMLTVGTVPSDICKVNTLTIKRYKKEKKNKSTGPHPEKGRYHSHTSTQNNIRQETIQVFQ